MGGLDPGVLRKIPLARLSWVKMVMALQMFDVGGTYLLLPPWVPFGQTVSITAGVVLGRWIGSGLLG